MRIAVSTPDKTLERAEALAKSLGLSQSEFIARAVDHYAAQLERSSLTTRIDAVIDRSGIDNDSTTAVVEAGRSTLFADGDEW